MTTTELEWERRIAELWASFEGAAPGDFLARVEALSAELPVGHPRALFERASAHDSLGQEALAAPLYRQALASGLSGGLRRQAVIQLASTLRNLGEVQESVALLTAERAAGSDELDDAVSAFLALSLVDAGREREAVGLALGALARHLPRYNRSLSNYAKALAGRAP
ncbi:tetratricopeptide repeat protein [Myxococcus llanfairpwllgwyngyllgogerychwyrndrobwllllantysiliogogogochensis]|uniref:Tetratricopeptide repeat protein n=1 Tax=Myxococcus llanfairpwllgwyngyllgogerychwyrndrobwllllantysiliogogogochensis TaxID=2590453 RepID=A0A540WTU4_9BACT|nr:tetratricopeptide repeat protein [Myxococcus llanfairpwllgwyngyllgogerychwyrndrobwllllantysiliogogogochensis]TQF12347.1 tetratricopeptide repeat protein [Myxococcus llanfairpwllgwyngyllgogerychwyrndrobwllllantysiliogogogochensis]